MRDRKNVHRVGDNATQLYLFTFHQSGRRLWNRLSLRAANTASHTSSTKTSVDAVETRDVRLVMVET